MPSDIDALYDASQKVTATDTQIGRISDLIRQEQDAEGDIEAALAALTDAKERKRNILLSHLPQAMLDAGMREFVTNDGLKAKVAFLTDGSLGPARTPEEFAERERKIDCIIENGGGEIVKQTVTIEFPKEFAHMAEELRQRIAKLLQTKKWGCINANVTRERSVNHMTLSSWIKERQESGDADEQLPPEFFEVTGIWYGEGVKMQQPRRKKE